jgi:hypothetical protein
MNLNEKCTNKHRQLNEQAFWTCTRNTHVNITLMFNAHRSTTRTCASFASLNLHPLVHMKRMCVDRTE